MSERPDDLCACGHCRDMHRGTPLAHHQSPHCLSRGCHCSAYVIPRFTITTAPPPPSRGELVVEMSDALGVTVSILDIDDPNETQEELARRLADVLNRARGAR